MMLLTEILELEERLGDARKHFKTCEDNVRVAAMNARIAREVVDRLTEQHQAKIAELVGKPEPSGFSTTSIARMLTEGRR